MNTMNALQRHALHRAKPIHPHEVAICALMNGIHAYGYAHATLGSNVADDGVLGPCVAGLLENVQGLLDGELDRLDGGECWRELECLAHHCGWKSLDDACNNA